MSQYATFEEYGQPPQDEHKTEGGKLLMEVQNKQHKHKLLQENGLVVVDVYGSWCGPCKVLAPKLEEMAGKFTGRVLFLKENVDLGLTDNVQGVPTLQVFLRGRLVKELVGADLTELNKVLNQLLVR
jgi:thioredoxin 1